MAQIRVNINGIEINTHSGNTILEVSKANGIVIPTLCNNENLEHYGSCGMCVVEVENNPRLVRSCSTDIQDGMVILTDTKRIVESRKTTLELMLSDHKGDCKAPCYLGCPSNVDIQGYVGLTANEEYLEALKLIKEDLPLPASIGRVCPHPCQTGCRRGLIEDSISIAWIKRFVADKDLNSASPYIPKIAPATNKRVAVIGGGPGGLSAAYFLRRSGHDVVLYEAMPEFGGMLKYGIPLYRLPKAILDQEVKLIEKLGVKLIPNTQIGKDITLEHIRSQFDVVYISIGAWKSSYLNCSGSNSEGIIGGIEFLNKFALNDPIRTGNRIAVIGGGNTAMDAARTAIRLGAKEVYAIYRRTKEDMPAVDIEIEEAEEEGVVFKFLSNPIEFISDESGKVTAMRLQKMKQTVPDASGRTAVVGTDQEELLEVDSVIMSIGQKLVPTGFEDLLLNERGYIDLIEGTFMTNLEGVFAGGDAVMDGPGIAIQAIADGKNATKEINQYLRGEKFIRKSLFTVKKENVKREDFSHIISKSRLPMGHESANLRIHNFEEVVHGFTPLNVVEEANRCLECGCMDSHECQLFDYSKDYDVQPERFEKPTEALAPDNAHPYFLRDSDKCILCGMCVRICDEVMGHGILGFVNRGFDTIIKPAFGKTFQETECISCGQCVSLCPTGALQERALIHKSVPLKAEVTHSICNQCGLGCHVKLESKGSLLLRSLPKTKNAVNNGLLCEKGRFNMIQQQIEPRFSEPMIRKNGKLEVVDWDEAIHYIARRAQSLNLRYGENSIATMVSGRYLNEAIFMLKKMANETFQTKHVYATRGYKKGLKDVLGYDASTNLVSELGHTNLIITIGTRIMEKQPILGVIINKAVNKGVEFLIINDQETKADQWANNAFYNLDNLDLLKGIMKKLLDAKGLPENATGYEELKQSLEDIEISVDAGIIADKLIKSKNAMIVYDRDLLTDDAVLLIAQIAVVSRHIGRPRNGLIQLRSDGNTQGLVDLGVNMDTQDLYDKVESEQVKGLIILDPDDKIILKKELEFLVIQGAHSKELKELADALLPSPSHVESNGTMTSQERRIQSVGNAVPSKTALTTVEQIENIMKAFSNNEHKVSRESILENIGKEIPEYLNAHETENEDRFWPIGKSRILYGDRYATESGKAKLQPVYGVKMYESI